MEYGADGLCEDMFQYQFVSAKSHMGLLRLYVAFRLFRLGLHAKYCACSQLFECGGG